MGGLAAGIGFAQRGHNVVVLEKLQSPAVRGTVDRDRSYPVDVTARGMAALEALGTPLEGLPVEVASQLQQRLAMAREWF